VLQVNRRSFFFVEIVNHGTISPVVW